MSVGIVVVSHSKALADAALELADIMVHGNRPPVAVAAGLAGGEFGTDALTILHAIESVQGDGGVAVFIDMGSAVLSAETALDLLDDPTGVRIVAAPFVEGLTAGLVRAALGGSLDEVVDAAEESMDAKLESLGRAPARRLPEITPDEPGVRVQLVNEVGLHARPAARLASLATQYEAEVQVTFDGKAPVNAKSTMLLMALGAVKGDWLTIEAEGPDAAAAVKDVAAFIVAGLGD